MDLSTGLMALKTWQRYQLGSINAEKAGNAARFANEGFPNCMTTLLPLYRGSLDWYALLACSKEGINPGEEILWDHGIGECLLKWNSLYTIPNKDAMHAFIKAHTVEMIDRYSTEHSLRFNPTIAFTKENYAAHQQAEAYLTQLYYCFHTPAAVIDLWCESLITASHWTLAMINLEKKQQRYTQPVHKNALTLTYQFMHILTQLETALHKNAPKRIKPVKEWIADLASKLTMIELAEVCVDMLRWLKEPVRDSWDDFSEKLAKKHTHQPERDISTMSLLKAYTKATLAQNSTTMD